MENLNPSMEGNKTPMDTEQLFTETLNQSEKEPLLKMLLAQTDVTSGKTVLELIKDNVLEKRDEGVYYGHIGTLVDDTSEALAEKSFMLPSLGIEIQTGIIRDLPDGRGMRLSWKNIERS